MAEIQKDQISQWLKKLERESWQLELLVSAFTIFLLIQAIGAFTEFLKGFPYDYDLSGGLSIIYLFFALINVSLVALAGFLIIHLMLRGFWIGTIGLRSVQSDVDFEKLKYSELFTEKLRKKVISLDNLAIMLDEICSLIFSFAFLVMSIILAFGMYLLFLATVAVFFGSIVDLFSGLLSTIIGVISAIVFFTILISGLIYLIDYFTLGFFKKYRLISKIYYPFYRLYGVITIAPISRSIYYYLISKFSKKKIRIVYLIGLGLILFTSLVEYDQHQFFPTKNDQLLLSTNYYDNTRPQDEYVEKVSIQSNIINTDYIQLFLRYSPGDNDKIRSNCPDFIPLKQEGFNWSMKFERSKSGFSLIDEKYEEEDRLKLMACLAAMYQVSINDSIFTDIKYYYYEHPSKGQKGLVTMLNTRHLEKGESILQVKKVTTTDEGEEEKEDYVQVPFWVQ